ALYSPLGTLLQTRGGYGEQRLVVQSADCRRRRRRTPRTPLRADAAEISPSRKLPVDGHAAVADVDDLLLGGETVGAVPVGLGAEESEVEVHERRHVVDDAGVDADLALGDAPLLGQRHARRVTR